MYFEIVLFASLRCINDISLMNFSILPRGDLYMLQFIACVSVVLMFHVCLAIHCFNLVLFACSTSVDKRPFCLGLQR